MSCVCCRTVEYVDERLNEQSRRVGNSVSSSGSLPKPRFYLIMVHAFNHLSHQNRFDYTPGEVYVGVKYTVGTKIYGGLPGWATETDSRFYRVIEVGVWVRIGEGLCVVSDILRVSSERLLALSSTHGDVFIPLFTVRETEAEFNFVVLFDLMVMLENLGLNKLDWLLCKQDMYKMIVGDNSIVKKLEII